jgi:drug/metabolite transporter (DMT)-like permease
MTLVFALGGALSLALGIFLTKGVTERFPMWQAVGPLFLFNALIALPYLPFSGRWVVFEPTVLLLHLASTATQMLGAFLVFTLIARGTASAVAIGQTLSPAVIVVLAPLMLGAHFSVIRTVIVASLMIFAIAPIRNGFSGLRSTTVVIAMVASGISNGFLTLLTAQLDQRGIGLAEIYIVRTTLAGIIYTAIFPPRDIRGSDLPTLLRRSLFMSSGFALSIMAIHRGDVLLVQTVMATVPLMTLLIESIVYRKAPGRSIAFSALATGIGIVALEMLSR